jgi:peptidoglycan/LPS O-acetylase OafA/YrhL
VGLALLTLAALAFATLPLLLTRRYFIVPQADILAAQGNSLDFFGPLLTGAGYAALMLSVLLLGGPLAAVFAWGPMRFIGLMSYSLYLWHLPFVDGWMPFMGPRPLPWRIAVAFVVAYLSYRLLERPFLAGRKRLTERAAASGASPAGSTTEGKVAVGG